MSSFSCFLCEKTYSKKEAPCLHYDESEKDEHGEVSLCDTCAGIVQKLAKESDRIQELSVKFFNCDKT